MNFIGKVIAMEPLHVWAMVQHELSRKSRERQRPRNGEAQDVLAKGMLRTLWSGLFRRRLKRRADAC